MDIDENPEVEDAYKFLEENKVFIDSRAFRNKEAERDRNNRDLLLMNNKRAREAYAKDMGLDEVNFGGISNNTYIMLDDKLFNMDETDDSIFVDQQNNINNRNASLAGNLSHLWDRL